MIRIALVEDDTNYVSELVNHLEQYEEQCKVKIHITVFSDGEDIAVDYKPIFDIILMDVEMIFMDGMTAAAKIREVDPEVVIIFITNMPQYAIQGYKVDALDYVLKPVDYFAFSQRMDRALSRMERRKKNFITISIKGGKVKLDISRICYVEVQNHDMFYHTIDGTYLTKGTMTDAQKALDEEQFFRCNRCYLVNLEYVESIDNYDIQVHSHVIAVSRARKKAFLNALNNYIHDAGK